MPTRKRDSSITLNACCEIASSNCFSCFACSIHASFGWAESSESPHRRPIQYITESPRIAPTRQAAQRRRPVEMPLGAEHAGQDKRQLLGNRHPAAREDQEHHDSEVARRMKQNGKHLRSGSRGVFGRTGGRRKGGRRKGLVGKWGEPGGI